MKKFIFMFLAAAQLFSSACAMGERPRTPTPPTYTPSQLAFSIDFESSQILPTSDPQSELLTFPLPDGRTAGMSIFYEAGTETDRRAEIVDNPQGAGKVLHEWVLNPKVPEGTPGKFKGRVQAGMANQAITTLFVRESIFLPYPDIEAFKYWPESNAWYALHTLWVGEVWLGELNGGKLTVTISKNPGNGTSPQPLYLGVVFSVYSGGPPAARE